MHTRILESRHAPTLLVRPLRHRDVHTVLAVFERLSDESRRARFNGPKPSLTRTELRRLATVDSRNHVLVGYVKDDPKPVAIAQLVREGRTAEIAFAVADEYQQQGIGTALTGELIADARAAGVTEITALVASDNPAALALLRRIIGVLDVSFEGRELSIRAAIA